MRNVMMTALMGGLLLGCASIDSEPPETPTTVTIKAATCENDQFALYSDLPTGRINGCEVTSERFVLTITPENTPINNSPWYAFHVVPKTKNSDTLRIRLKYVDGTHRYQPKVSFDGTTWAALPKSAIELKNKKTADIHLKSKGRPFFLAGQEMFTVRAQEKLIDGWETRPYLEKSVIGKSINGHPIYMLESDGGADKPIVMLVGRQHPPELTGALAMVPFLETLFGDSAKARSFRREFDIVTVPMMNPDGVTEGYWRHNISGKDLNRDWGPFTEPETQAVRSVLDRLDAQGRDIMFFLDFHSTRQNLLYTQTDDEPTDPPMFARDWVAAVAERTDKDAYPFTRKPSPNSDRPTSKNYMYDRYGIPAITYEVGDETDRKALSDAAVIFAEEMMDLLMDHKARP